MKTFEEFVKDIYPNIEKRYELYKLTLTPEKLIGLKVMAIRAGFGCDSEGGTKMTIEKIDEPRKQLSYPYEMVVDVHFKPNEDTSYWPKINCPNGWMCYLSELPHSVVPY